MSAVNRRRKSEDEILDLDYLAHNSSLDGMLSHLKPELRTAFQQAGSSLPALNPVHGPGQLPTTSVAMGLSVEATPPSVTSSDAPMGLSPMGLSSSSTSDQTTPSDTPMGHTPMGPSPPPDSGPTTPSDTPMGHTPMGLSTSLAQNRAAPGDMPTGPLPALASDPAIRSGTLSDEPTGRIPVTEDAVLEGPDFFDQPIADAHQPSEATATYDIEGVGKRRFYRCRNVQDGHTNGEQVAYTTIWSYAKRYGHYEEEGSYLVDLSISRFCQLITTDHKHARKLLDSLEEKLAIAIAKPPNFRLNSPASYRVFNYSQILDRRDAAGLIWVVRNRAIQFISPEQVNMIISDTPMGLSPMGLSPHTSERPMGRRPERPMGHRPPPILIKENSERKTEVNPSSSSSSSQLVEAVVFAVAQILPVDDDAAKKALAKADPTLRQAEAVHCAQQAATKVARQKNATNPTGLWITQFARYASGTPLKLYRAQSATEKANFQQMGITDEDWTAMLNNPDVAEDQRVLARRMLDVPLQQNP